MRIDIYQDARGYWRWRLRAANHKIVAESGEGYSARHKAVDAVERLAGPDKVPFGDLQAAVRRCLFDCGRGVQA